MRGGLFSAMGNDAFYEDPKDKVEYAATRDTSDYSMLASWDPTLSQINSMMKLGSTRPHQNGDLGTCPPDCRKENLIARFDSALKQEQALDKKQRSIWRLLLTTLGVQRLAWGVMLAMLGSGSSFAGPLLLKAITNHITGSQPLTGGAAQLWILIDSKRHKQQSQRIKRQHCFRWFNECGKIHSCFGNQISKIQTRQTLKVNFLRGYSHADFVFKQRRNHGSIRAHLSKAIAAALYAS
jgi:hypothetical protein